MSKMPTETTTEIPAKKTFFDIIIDELKKERTKALSQRRSLTNLARVKYPEEVLKEFIENEEFIIRYRETENGNAIESTQSENSHGKKAVDGMKKLGMKEFDERAEKAIWQIKENREKTSLSDLQILAYLSGHRKIASDVIRELRDNKLSVGDGEFDDGLGSKTQFEGFVKQLSAFRRALFPGDIDFIEQVGIALDGLNKTMNESNEELLVILEKYGIFEEFHIFQRKNHGSEERQQEQWKEKYPEELQKVIGSVGSEIRMPNQQEMEMLLQKASPQNQVEVKAELLEMMTTKVEIKNQLMFTIRNYALDKLNRVVEESSVIRNGLNKYLEETLKLEGEELQKAQDLIAKLEKNGGRKDTLLPQEWKDILQNVKEEERQHAKDMVIVYIMSAERAVDQFIAQRGNINVRNDELRARGIDLNNEGVQDLLAKLEESQEIDSDEWNLISEGVDEDDLEDFKNRIYKLSNKNNDYNRDEDLRNHNEDIKKILKQDPKDLETEIAKLRSLSGVLEDSRMVDNLTEEEWERVLKNVDSEDKDRVKEELITLIRDFEKESDEKAQPEYRKILTASQVALVDDHAAIKIQGKFRASLNRVTATPAEPINNTPKQKITTEEEEKEKEDKLAAILELIAKLTVRVEKLEEEKELNEDEKARLSERVEKLENKQGSNDEERARLRERVKALEDEKQHNDEEKEGLRDAIKKLQQISEEQVRGVTLSDIEEFTEDLESTFYSDERSESNSSENSSLFGGAAIHSEDRNIRRGRSYYDDDSYGFQKTNVRSNRRQRVNYPRGKDYAWTQQPPIVNNIYGAGYEYGAGYGVGGYGNPSNIESLLAQSTEGLKKEIEEVKAAFLSSEAAAKEAAKKAQQEIQDANAASIQRANEAIASNQQKANDAIAANQRKVEETIAAHEKEYADKMAEMKNKAIADAKAAKEREEKRRNAMEPDWDERDVTYEELDKIGHLSDGNGLAVISEIRGQKKGKLGEEGYFPGMTTYKNGSSVAVYDGKKGLERFTREVEQSAAKEWSGKDGRPVASIARIDNLEKEGDSVFCLATASPSGTTKTFISPEIYQTKINSIADVEYEMALSSAVRINALTKYVDALKKAAEKLQIAQPLIFEDFPDDRTTLSNDDDELVSQLSDEDANLTDNESILSDSAYSPKEDIEHEIARIEDVLNNMNAVYKGRKGITREEKKQYLEDMWHLDPMDPDLMNLLKEQDKKSGNKLEKLEDSVFAPQEISISTKDATRVQKEFARLYSAQETNRSVGDMVEKSAQKNKLSVDLDSQEVEKLSNEFAMRQRGKGTRVASNILVPWNVMKGMKQAFDPGKGAYETLLEQPIQHSPLEGISILRPRGTGNIATVCFEGNARKDIAYLYVPETDYIISVRRAKNTGKVASYEGGPMVDCVANEIIIPKDTVFKLVDGKHVAVPLASLSKRDREFYDNFQVKAMSNVDGQRKMTTLFKGEVRQYNDLDKKIAYDIDSDQVIKFEVTGVQGHLLEKKIEGAEKVGESYVIQIGSIPDQFGNPLVNLKGVLVADPNNKGGLVIEGPYIEQEDGTAKLLDKKSLEELYADLGVTNPKHQKTFAEITKEIRQTKVMATIVKEGQEHVVKLPITDGVTPSTVVKEAMIAGQMGHTIQNPVRVGPKGGGGRGAGG